ncbi:MAG: hypothetical protein IIV51_03000 [Lachnospiraceae bacterium]|nr:hypothetical protein [Lachnospiraceae bacterium]
MSKDKKNIDIDEETLDTDTREPEDDSFLDDDEVDIDMLQNIIDEIEDIKPYEERRRNRADKLSAKKKKEKVNLFENINAKMVLIFTSLILSLVLLVVLVVDVTTGSSAKKSEDVTKIHMKEVTNKEIQTLVNDYIAAIENVDMKSLKTLVDDIDNVSEDKLQLEKQYIEAYNDIELRFVKGQAKDEYVVFASYNNKIVNIDTQAPGAMMIYVAKKDGKYVVCTAVEKNDKILEYIKSLAGNEEIIEYNDDVNKRLENACKKDKNLAKFISAISPMEPSNNEDTTSKKDEKETTTKKSSKEEETTTKKKSKKEEETTTKKKSSKEEETTTKKKSKKEEETTTKKSSKKDEKEKTTKKSSNKDKSETTKSTEE